MESLVRKEISNKNIVIQFPPGGEFIRSLFQELIILQQRRLNNGYDDSSMVTKITLDYIENATNQNKTKIQYDLWV